MALDKALLMEMLRRMVRIRLFEEEVVRMVERGEIPGAAPLLHRRGGGRRRRLPGPAAR